MNGVLQSSDIPCDVLFVGSIHECLDGHRATISNLAKDGGNRQDSNVQKMMEDRQSGTDLIVEKFNCLPIGERISLPFSSKQGNANHGDKTR